MAADDSVKLLDFGIAARRGARRLTFGHWSTIMGTPDYISPEQIKGKRGDARSDIFALGVILYEMLTGEPPVAESTVAVVMNSRLQRGATIGAEVEAKLDPAMAQIVRRATANDPKARYSSAREMALELRNPCGGQRIEESAARETPVPRRVLIFSALTMIPALVFLLLLIAAHHQL